MENDSLDWKIVCLEIEGDIGSFKVSGFLSELWPSRVIRFPVQNHKIILKNDVENLLSDISQISGKILTVYGHGYFHHYTYGLLKNIADLRSKNYTYVHFDQHSDNDNAQRIPGAIDCSNFVKYLDKNCANADNSGDAMVNNSAVESVKYIGCRHIFNKVSDANLLTPSVLENGSVAGSVDALMHDSSSDVYVSVDLDVLLDKEMRTGWPGGSVRTSCLLDVLSYLKSEKNIISADALGFCLNESERRNCFFRPVNNHRKSLLVYAMIAGVLFGEDISKFENEHSKL